MKARRIIVIAAAAVAGILAGTAGVYFMGSGNGNVGSQAAIDCAGALATAKRIEPHAKGEVAAFRPASAADSLADVAFLAPDGKETTLGALGKTTLVNLWATWCVPCRVEMPALDRLEEALGSDQFQVVAVNIDLGDSAKARAFMDDIGIRHLAFYSDPTTGVFKALKGKGLAFGLPTTVLVDGKGCRIGVVEGPAEWDSEDAKALIGAALAATAASL